MPDPPGACMFSQNESGEIRVVETPKGDAALIVSSKRGQAEDRWCDTTIYGLVYRAKESPHWGIARVPQRVAMCPPQQWDQKMFMVFAQDVEWLK